MKKVHYKGHAYSFKVLNTHNGVRLFSLYNNEGLLVHFVEEHKLDKPSLVTSILQAYYRSIMQEEPPLFG